MTDWSTTAGATTTWQGRYLEALFIARPHRGSQLMLRRNDSPGGLPEPYQALSFPEIAELKAMLDKLFALAGDEGGNEEEASD